MSNALNIFHGGLVYPTGMTIFNGKSTQTGSCKNTFICVYSHVKAFVLAGALPNVATHIFHVQITLCEVTTKVDHMHSTTIARKINMV